MAQAPKVAVYSNGANFLYAAALATAILAAAAHSAGAYTAGSADYGQVITQLQNVNAEQGTVATDAGYQVTAAHDLINELSYPGTTPTGTAQDNWQNSIFWDTTGGGQSSIFAAYNNGTGPTTTGQQSVFKWWNTSHNGQFPDEQSTFIDQNGHSVFESPNGNSYFDWNPYNAAAVNVETTGDTNWNTASATTDQPYSVFRDNFGTSVFTNTNGQAYLSADYPVPHVANTTAVGSAFTTGVGLQTSVFQWQEYNANTGTGYGTTEDSSGYPEPMFSVFTAGSGTKSGNGAHGIGSVFVTDDTQNGNVDNSVFLDPYGNSYLDDITAALTLPIQTAQSPYASDGSQTSDTYTPYGQLVLTGEDGSANVIYGQQPLTLTELYVLATGEGVLGGANGTYSMTPSYNFLTQSAFIKSPIETMTTWYNGPQPGGWDYQNMFAQAFFNPPASGATTLVPYLSAFGGWQDSTTYQNSLTTNENNTTSAINKAEGQLDTTFNNYAPTTTPSPQTPATGLQGGWSTSWILPINAISTTIGTITDSDTATEGNNAGYALDNNSHNVVGAIQDLISRIQQGSGYNPPSNLLEYTKTTNLAPEYSGDGGDSPNGTSSQYATLDAVDDGEFSFLAGAVYGMQWFRANTPWLAYIFGFFLTLFTVLKAWQLIYWGINGGSFPLIFNPHNRVPGSADLTPGIANIAGTSTANVKPDFASTQEQWETQDKLRSGRTFTKAADGTEVS